MLSHGLRVVIKVKRGNQDAARAPRPQKRRSMPMEPRRPRRGRRALFPRFCVIFRPFGLVLPFFVRRMSLVKPLHLVLPSSQVLT
jgi:hypothetical protein